MKVRFHTMAGTLHSWSLTTLSIARAMVRVGNPDIFIKSTNGLEFFPEDLKSYLLPGCHGPNKHGLDWIDPDGSHKLLPFQPNLVDIDDVNRPYDLDFAYTVFLNGPRRFYPESKRKALIWNFESSILPPGWEIYANSVDYILPSSQYSYDIFAQNNIPKDKMIIVPHGVDTNIFNPNIPPFKLKTTKKVKFLHNAINHARKMHERVVEAYLDAFTGNDDVCLVLKTKFKAPDKDKPFEVDVKQAIENVYKRYKNPAEIEVINDVFIEDIGSLYTACDVVVSMSSCEGFGLPMLESLACGNLLIAARHGGQLDFLNDENSLLVDTKEMKAPMSHQYWEANKDAVVGDPSVKHCTELMRRAYENLETEKARIKESAKKMVEKFTWETAAQMILDLPIPTRQISHKRKVLYIIPYDMVGGGEIWVKEAIKRIDRTAYEPHVALVSGSTPEFIKELELLDVKIENLKDLGTLKGLKVLVESNGYSLIHFYNSFGVYQTLKECWHQGYRCRIVETVHSDLNWNDSMMRVARREEFVCAIAAVSKTMATKLAKIGNKKVFHVPQHINWDKFRATKDKGILDNHNIKRDFVVGFMGRLSPEKNIPIILRIAKQLPEITFVIVGDGPQKGPLQQMGYGMRNVNFMGSSSSPEQFYSAFDVLLLPSLMEGMPLVILEAQKMGVPVIASAVGAIPDIIENGVNGFTIKNSNDVNSFVLSIKTLYENKELLAQMNINSINTAEKAKTESIECNINSFYNVLF